MPLQVFSLPMGDVYGESLEHEGEKGAWRADAGQRGVPSRAEFLLSLKAAVFCAMA